VRHKTDDNLRQICGQIITAGKTSEEWAKIESDDMFALGNYEGGFDATEMMFCFSLHDTDKEYWFQISLDEVEMIYAGKKEYIDIVPATE